MAMQDTHQVTAVSWDAAKQAFVVNISADQTIVSSADLFDLKVRIAIFDQNRQRVAVIDPKGDGIAAGGPPDNLGMVPLFPVTIPWDRNDGTYSGVSNVRVNVAITTNREKLLEKGLDIKI